MFYFTPLTQQVYNSINICRCYEEKESKCRIVNGGYKMNSKEMLKYKNWAVVGASADESSFGYKIYKKLELHGYRIFLVSPKYDTIGEHPVYKSIKDIEEKIDVVEFVVNPTIGLKVLKECIELGIDKIWLQPGTRSEELIKEAEEHGINVIQSCVLVEL